MYFKTETLVGAFVALALGILVYMSFQLGSVHFDLARYATYSVRFKDVTGLVPTSDIKIAGVKVGWIQSIALDPKTLNVDVSIKVLKDFRMHEDASAVIRQEGMLGSKYLEIVPGTAGIDQIPFGGDFPYQKENAVGIEEILGSVNTLAKKIEGLTATLEESVQEFREILFAVRTRLAKIDGVFADIAQARRSFELTADVVQKTGKQVSNMLPSGEASTSSSLAQLLQDDQLYQDIKETSQYARGCVDRVRGLCVGLDSHLEVLPSSYKDCSVHDDKKTDVKWYFNAYGATATGLFAKLGLASSQKGFARHRGFVDKEGMLPAVYGHRDAIRLNFQVGKYWHPYGALRIGLFEGTAGVGLDWWLMYTDIKWLTTFEAFDFNGHNRFICDRRPHLKWLNRLFFTNTMYITFGADDFISRCNRSGFIGIGSYFSLPSFFSCS